MNVVETAALLARASQIDARVEVTDDTVETWHDLIGDLAAADVANAIRTHYRATSDRIMPSHIRSLVNGAPDAGRAARAVWDRDARGIPKPAWFDAAVEEARQEARRSGRFCRCAHHGPRERS